MRNFNVAVIESLKYILGVSKFSCFCLFSQELKGLKNKNTQTNKQTYNKKINTNKKKSFSHP